MKRDFDLKYQDETDRLDECTQVFQLNKQEISKIDNIYKELSVFLEKNSDAKILTKINDISGFMNKSIEDLERITRDKASIEDIHLSESLAPLTLNIEKVFYII